MKAPRAANDNLIDQTIAVWQREISREEARQFAENVAGFFSLLVDWSRCEAPAAANDNERRQVAGRLPDDR